MRLCRHDRKQTKCSIGTWEGNLRVSTSMFLLSLPYLMASTLRCILCLCVMNALFYGIYWGSCFTVAMPGSCISQCFQSLQLPLILFEM